jgi:hypothetical protein
LLKHPRPVNPGKRAVFNLGSGAIALLAASAGGYHGEDGGGAMLVAPELLGPAAPVLNCDYQPGAEVRELTFERLGAVDQAQLPRLMAEGSHLVAFEWHAATGELTLVGATGAMFSDLENAATTKSNVALRIRRCESR